jgi:hypothetical protein
MVTLDDVIFGAANQLVADDLGQRPDATASGPRRW